jgi:transposase
MCHAGRLSTLLWAGCSQASDHLGVALGSGRAEEQESSQLGTITRDLLALADWLRHLGVTHVAMESTGVYRKPVWNVLEGEFQLLLVNAQHVKAVPGRKTDLKDCEWIADLVHHGLLRASFVPEPPIRELRDLTRYRAVLAQERATVANRIQKALEDANLKLASVATYILGQSGRSILKTLLAGERTPRKSPSRRSSACGRKSQSHAWRSKGG